MSPSSVLNFQDLFVCGIEQVQYPLMRQSTPKRATFDLRTVLYSTLESFYLPNTCWQHMYIHQCLPPVPPPTLRSTFPFLLSISFIVFLLKGYCVSHFANSTKSGRENQVVLSLMSEESSIRSRYSQQSLGSNLFFNAQSQSCQSLNAYPVAYDG